MRRSDPFGLGAGLPRLRRGLRVDHLGDERLVLDPASGVVHTVRGPAVAELDRVLTGRAGLDDEVLAALVASGVVEILGVGRRQALALSGTAALLVSTALLPSATAAASVGGSQVPSPQGIVSQFSVSDFDNTYDLYRVAHTSEATSVGDLTRSITVGTTGDVHVLLVGGGGGGGTITIGSTHVGGGGGGGEVHEVRLPSVAAETVLTVVVGGQSLAGSNGQPTYVKIGDVVQGLARGGGRGAGDASAAGDGGSGGGGSSAYSSGGSMGPAGDLGGGASTFLGFGSSGYGGGGGQAGRGGGGGGAGGAGTARGDVGYGGFGGSPLDANLFFLDYSIGSSPNPGEYRHVAAGGGGGGSTYGGDGGVADEPIGGIGANPGGLDPEGPNSMNGLFATGSGGGGGAASSDTAYGGRGASGVAWVRIPTS